MHPNQIKITRLAHSARPALSLVECLVIAAIILGLIVLWSLMPRITHCGEPSKRLVCGSNLKGIGTSMKIYANDNGDTWPTPAFDDSLTGKITYTIPVGEGRGTVESPSRNQQSLDGPGGARELSTTRAFWMLVRSGDVTVNQFVCPNSKDVNDPTSDLDDYYDFTSYENISYGFQVPFGPPNTRAREGQDNRMIVAADKGPYYLSDTAPNWNIGAQAQPISLNDSPKAWKPFNSPNHGGAGNGEGQNCLFMDGHIEFQRTPTVGSNADNIYTIALDHENWESRCHGEIPGLRSATPLDQRPDTTLESRQTDSVIFP